MKRFLVSLAVVGLAMMPIAASASTLVSGQQYSLSPQQTINGNAYAVAGMATFGGRVAGDLAVAGGTVSVTGTVDGDVLAAGGTVQILGPVSGDVRVFGGTISINGPVGGEVMVAGGTVHILPDAVVTGDLAVAGGQVIIDGVIHGDVQMAGTLLTINGIVDGNVVARSGKPIVMGSDAMVNGKVSFTQVGANRASIHPDARGLKLVLIAILGILTSMKLLAYLGFAALLLWMWRRPTLAVLAEVHGAFWPSVGRGIVYGVLVPVAAILLAMSIIGTFAGVILVLVYVALMILASVFAGMFAGAWLAKVITKKSALQLTWVSGLGGVLLLEIVALIPVVGWIVAMLLCIALFGALAHTVQRWLAAL